MKADEFTASATAVQARPAPRATTQQPVAVGPMIRFACASCDDRLVVPARHAGRRGKCPRCGTVNRVPAKSQFDAPPAVATATADAPSPLLPAVAAQVAAAPVIAPFTFNFAPADSTEAEADIAPAREVMLETYDAAGLSPAVKLALVGGIIGVLLLSVWVVFYVLIWSRMAMAA